jgi:hypothetical protein
MGRALGCQSGGVSVSGVFELAAAGVEPVPEVQRVVGEDAEQDCGSSQREQGGAGFGGG